MKHSHLLLIFAAAAAAILAVTALYPREISRNSEKPAATQTAQKDPALVLGGKSFDPLCLANTSMEEANPAYKLDSCADGDLIADNDAPPPPYAGEFKGTAYKSKSDESVRGTIGYQYIGDVDGHKALWIVQNSGGSGVFSSLVLLDYDEEKNVLSTFQTVASGDRCNGGVSGAQIVDGKLTYERDMTPYDMLQAAGDNPALKTEFASSVPSCAACCYGKAQYENGKMTGIVFDPRLPAALKDKAYGPESKAEQCVDGLILENFKSNKGYCSEDDLGNFAAAVGKKCLGGP